MSAKLLGVAGVIVVAAVVLSIIFMAVAGKRDYAERPAQADSPEVKLAFEVLRNIVGQPRAVEKSMSSDAGKRARARMNSLADQMAGASSMDFESAGWYGDYLRVDVPFASRDGRNVKASHTAPDNAQFFGYTVYSSPYYLLNSLTYS